MAKSAGPGEEKDVDFGGQKEIKDGRNLRNKSSAHLWQDWRTVFFLLFFFVVRVTIMVYVYKTASQRRVQTVELPSAGKPQSPAPLGWLKSISV